MRKAAADALVALAREDDRVVLITADLGFMVLEEFAAEFPERFLNVGVAESNMMSLAAGMAARGLIPFCYSIATFASMRGYEQIRDGAVVHGLPVRIIGIGGGFSYGTAGITHHALEDYAVMRCQPGLSVVAPTDDLQAAQALRSTVDHQGPIYFRIGKDPLTLPVTQETFHLGSVSRITSGEVMVLATGSMSQVAFDTVARLSDRGVNAGLTLVPTLQPLERLEFETAIADAHLAITIEDHYINGGLGSLVSEIVAESAMNVRVIRSGVSQLADGVSGSEKFLRTRHGLDADAISARVLSLLELKPTS